MEAYVARAENASPTFVFVSATKASRKNIVNTTMNPNFIILLVVALHMSIGPHKLKTMIARITK